MIKMDKTLLRKNILDTEFQKYLIIASTSAIMGFTYFIGLTIATLSKQIDLNNPNQLILLMSISSITLSVVLYYSINSINKIKRITKAIKKLEKSI